MMVAKDAEGQEDHTDQEDDRLPLVVVVGLYVDPGLGLMVGGIILIAVALYESYFWPTKKG